MKVGITKEIFRGECRVAATPETVKRMVKLGLAVTVEPGAGLGSHITDADYKDAGATLGEHLGWLLQGIWAVGIGVLLLRTRQVPSWFGAMGLALATGWAVLVPIGTAADVAWAETLGVAVLYTVWFVWVGALGLLILGRARRRAGTG